ncbi:Hypothetical predicted protein [Podarcis lilfordi]|uniref:Uncharacterized protein n=1 Tax=Podarcis lilfordi TaxID=74358 RepID=A0AA35JKZ2_9SAUR|nr:Hypothetical predicted protein [Podarcis lilfordi]
MFSLKTPRSHLFSQYHLKEESGRKELLLSRIQNFHFLLDSGVTSRCKTSLAKCPARAADSKLWTDNKELLSRSESK